MKKLNKLALVALAAMSFNAIAQENPWMVRARATHLNWDNSTTNTVTTLGVNADNKIIPEIDITYFFTNNIAAELVLSYPQRVEVFAGSASLGTVTALPPTLLAQYHFTNFGPLKPYVGAGLNYTRFGSRNLGVDNTSNGYYVEKSSIGYALQAGADYMLTKNWGINLDVKYIDIKTDVFTAAGANAGTLKLSPIATSVGVTYKF
ncbi:OmpW family protein [Polynucleobacter sp. MWH-Loch1C5]|uniref:OmpW/AlkL family protein n=1 Tax=Polynucleobacter sp. MWH-Loch1C5 TaxID=2689108 RepID=UPI001C0C5135|nr:OmpW family outer membrane protein [Polynucleobacter sp. MWH-Loch1C5]MBU3542343.1 OmpW family protein [Polynucleobacter sp. MWH-Loch1C5]